MDSATLWETVIQGIVQGITEFLPISSDGHLVIIGHFLERWLGKSSTGEETLQLVIGLHLGTLLAVIVVYWPQLWSLLNRPRLLAAIVVGTIPAGVIGVLFKDWFEQTMSSPLFAGLGLFVTAIFLLAGQKLELNLLELDDIPLPHAFAIGCFQALAILPGVSRSGGTIAGALMIGITRQAAATFSFLLSVPAVGGAVLLGAYAMWKGKGGDVGPAQIALGATISFVIGLFALRLLIRLVTQRKLHWFAFYCLALGAAVVTWELTQSRPPQGSSPTADVSAVIPRGCDSDLNVVWHSVEHSLPQ